MSPLLRKNGNLVTKGGKLVKVTDPAKCPCCTSTPDPCVGGKLPLTCKVTLHSAVSEGDRPPFFTRDSMNQALKITVNCNLVGGNYSGFTTPPGASRQVTATVQFTNNAGDASASISGGGTEVGTRLNLPIPGASPVQGPNTPSIASFGYTGRSEDIDGSPLPDPALTIKNLCDGTLKFKLPAYVYPELGGVGQIWAGYKWYGDAEYWPFFDGSDGWLGADLAYIEVEFPATRSRSNPLP